MATKRTSDATSTSNEAEKLASAPDRATIEDVDPTGGFSRFIIAPGQAMPAAGLKPILTRIQVQSRNWLKGTNIFIRVRPAEIIDGVEVWQATMDMVGFRDEGGGHSDEILVPDPDILMDLPENAVIHRYRVYYCVTQRGRPHLWRVRLPGDDGKMWPQWEMQHDAAEIAQRRWLSLNAETMPVPAPTQDREPQWPDLTWGEVLQKAFKDKIVDYADHPLLKRLRGEIV
jgi:hypothetical protein